MLPPLHSSYSIYLKASLQTRVVFKTTTAHIVRYPLPLLPSYLCLLEKEQIISGFISFQMRFLPEKLRVSVNYVQV